LLQSTILIRSRWVEDESWMSNEAWTLVQEGRIRMPIFPADPRSRGDVELPVYVSTMAASFGAFGLGIPQARLVSALFATGVVIVVFFLASDIAGPLCGMLAALFAATDTFLVVAARTARPEALTTLLCWLALLLCYRAVQRHSVKLGFAAGAACGLGLVCHPLTLAFLCAIGLFYCMQYRWRVVREPLVWVFFVTAFLPVVPYLLWCFSDAAHIACFHDMFTNKAAEPLRARIIGEADRWRDFIGLASQRVALPFRVPFRIHIPIILTCAFAFLFSKDRKLAIPALTLLAVNIGWFFYMVNKGPRYLALLSPLFAILLAYFVAQSRGQPWHKIAIAAVVLVLITQVAGSAYWLYKFRTADYPVVARELQQIIPPGASVYGLITFWLALHDRTYYAYDRTPLDFATEKLRPQYMILYDRVMSRGSGHGTDDFERLRTEATKFVRSHGTLAGRVSNEFYGDLEIYRISY
jgi:4-amino-4-deoxy-L-arabinose transferase-like glycosyltransferase